MDPPPVAQSMTFQWPCKVIQQEEWEGVQGEGRSIWRRIQSSRRHSAPMSDDGTWRWFWSEGSKTSTLLPQSVGSPHPQWWRRHQTWHSRTHRTAQTLFESLQRKPLCLGSVALSHCHWPSQEPSLPLLLPAPPQGKQQSPQDSGWCCLFCWWHCVLTRGGGGDEERRKHNPPDLDFQLPVIAPLLDLGSMMKVRTLLRGLKRSKHQLHLHLPSPHHRFR